MQSIFYLSSIGKGPPRLLTPSITEPGRHSGQMTEERRIGGGRVRLPDALYMAAITAMRANSDMATTYRRLRADGKTHMVAVIAVMRKLVVLANILLRDDRIWSEENPRRLRGLHETELFS